MNSPWETMREETQPQSKIPVISDPKEYPKLVETYLKKPIVEEVTTPTQYSPWQNLPSN